MSNKEEFRNPDRTTKVTVRFLNQGWQEKIRIALQETKKSSIRDSIATAFAVLIPHRDNLTHGELARVIEEIANGTYTLETAMDELQKMQAKPVREKPVGRPLSKVGSFLDEMRKANAELV